MKKRKQRIFAIALLCSALVVMGIIQTSAYEVLEPQLFTTERPINIGEEVTAEYINNNNGIYIFELTYNQYQYVQSIWYTSQTNYCQNIQVNYNSITFNSLGYNEISACTFILTGTQRSITKQITEGNKYYFYVCKLNNTKNVNILSGNNEYVSAKVYKIKNYSYGDIEDAFARGILEGYNTGYNEGFTTAQDLKQDLNIVQHIEQLIAQFTGTEYAKYITPIALVLTILMIYFLFIRFILSLMKAKGVIKTCDILMIVACIIVLVCMYMPMINLEITQHQIIEQVETTSSNVYQVNSDITYYEYTDEQGNTIHGGPAGTWVETVETTTE